MKPPDPSASAEQYEALRCHIVERPARLGAILVAKAGVAGWMGQWARTSAAAVIPAAPLPLNAPVWQHELTMLLAGITACHLQPPSPS